MENANNNLEALRRNNYPGRGIVLGLNKSGSKAIQIYWVMGRSSNSQNRILIRIGETVRTAAFDEENSLSINFSLAKQYISVNQRRQEGYD